MQPKVKLDIPVVVAMSGGVDSCVAALLLAQGGYQAIGVSMQVWDYRNNGGCSSKATCCSPDDFTDARKVAHAIGIPYYVFDFEKEFRRDVIDKFINTYKKGMTPNPCVDCNNKVKFSQLRNRAAQMGYSNVATGHYAKIEKLKAGFVLKRPKDLKKDQSYFLYNLTQAELAKTLFPLAGYTKDEVRQLALEAGLSVASKPESQDICFISGSTQDFLLKIGGYRKKGKILKATGEILGEHEGIESFTIGQRKGLNLGGLDEPLYVTEIDPSSNQVFVGSKAELECDSFEVNELNWSHPDILSSIANVGPGYEFDAIAQLRYRHAGVPVRVRILESNNCSVEFKSKWTTVAPGQAAVFYDTNNQVLLGGGRIRASIRKELHQDDYGKYSEATV